VAVDTIIGGTVYIDFLQVGEAGAINGNPKKMALSVYLPWYRNPIEYGDSPNAKNKGWYNWAWYESGPTSMMHYPENVLPNGQRDIASILYPIVGAYSNVDEGVLRYQFEIMKAANLDGILITDYGKEILQDYRKCVDKMYKLAEEYDMKIALQYEPKIHFANWVPSTSGKSRDEKIQAIIEDIIYIIEHYAPMKSYLKIDGKPVIPPFDANLLSDTEWGYVKKQIKDRGFGEIYLIFDRIPDVGVKNIDAVYNWISGLDRNYPDYQSVYNFAKGHNERTDFWANNDFKNRLAIGVAWPGFDDTGVGGDWGSGTARKFPYLENDPTGSTLAATQNSVLNNNMDWIVYATFNDWNEATVIEPSVEFGYRFIQEVQEFLEGFKGLPKGNRNLMQAITEKYIAERDGGTKPEPEVTVTSAKVEASVEKLNGNKNNLTIKITEQLSDGSVNIIEETISINNNAAGTYEVGGYKVYVDTKGNTQIRECYLVK